MLQLKRGARRTAFILLGDVVILLSSYLAAYYVRFGYISGFSEKFPVSILIVITLGYLAIFYLFDLYSYRKDAFTVTSFVRMALSILAASVFVSFLKYGLSLIPIGRGIFFIANFIILVAAFLWRSLSDHLFQYLVKPKNVAVVGTGELGVTVAQIIREQSQDFKFIGFLVEAKKNKGMGGPPFDGNIIGSTDQLLPCLETYALDLIVLAYPEKGDSGLIDDILRAQLRGVEVHDSYDMYQILRQRVPLDYIKDQAWFLNFRGFEPANKTWSGKIERLLDIGVSSCVLLLSLPLWVPVAALIKLSSRGPVFYKQHRVGSREREFLVYKFRSMIQNAEEDQALWATQDDKRITAVGKVIRKIHVDELPQLWNVLRGDMSLVGPRPERPQFVNHLKQEIPFYSLRHLVKPGLTGWAQVNYPYASSLEDSKKKLEYDLYYIAHQSVFLDLLTLIKTAQKIFGGRNIQRS